MQPISEPTIERLEEFESLDLFNTVAKDIISVLVKYPDAKSIYRHLNGLYNNYDGLDCKLMFDFILSAMVQTKAKPFSTRYNLRTDDTEFIKEISDAITNNKLEELNCIKYSLATQNSLNLIRGYYSRRLHSLSRCIHQPMYVVISETNNCKRCYEETKEILCTACKEKLEKATAGQLKNFITTGTTIEAFNFKFKDWYVEVSSSGLYTFDRLDTSLEQYQMEIPFEENKNLQILIG